MDPQTGTFLSVDPMVTDRWDPQSYNGYSYARNNPISMTDPTGMCWFWGAFGCFNHDGYYVPPSWVNSLPSFNPPSGPAPSGGLGTLGIADVGSAGPSGIGSLGGAPTASPAGPQGGGSTGGFMATAAVIAIAEPTPIGEAALATVAVGITAVTAGTAMVRGVQALMEENQGGDGEDGGKSEGDNPTVKEVLKTKKGSIKKAPRPPGTPSWEEIEGLTMEEVARNARNNVSGFKQIKKLPTDSRFNK